MSRKYVDNVCAMLRRKGLSEKYECAGIYCIKLNEWTDFALINEDSVFRPEVPIRILLSRFTFGVFQKTKRQLPLCCNKIR